MEWLAKGSRSFIEGFQSLGRRSRRVVLAYFWVGFALVFFFGFFVD